MNVFGRIRHHRLQPGDGGDARPAETGSPALRALDESLRELAAIEGRQQARPEVGAALMQAWDEMHAGGGEGTRPIWRWVAGGAVAAGVMLAVAAGVFLRDTRRSPGGEAATAERLSDVVLAAAPPAAANVSAPPARASVARRATEQAAPVRPRTSVVVVGSPITAGEAVRVVRMRIARDTLIAMGLSPIGLADAERIDVEMLVGEDGVARGLRVGM